MIVKRLFKSVVFVALIASPLMLTAGEKEQKAAHELLQVGQYELLLCNNVDKVFKALSKMDPMIARHEVEIREFCQKNLTSESFTNELADVYAGIFTEKELKEIIKFYKSKTGKKMVETYPEVMKRMEGLAELHILRNLNELVEILLEKTHKTA